ncbi:MAG: hypothetical protein ACREB2_09025, partial [Pseudolabrys sp.]
YRLAGILTALAIGCVISLALGVMVGLAVGARPVTERGVTTQFVDRTHKGDRLSLPTDIGARHVPSAPRKVMVGCEPAFSPLLAAARATGEGRCIAALAHPPIG